MSKITLVIITFNEEANIRRCIESALAIVDEVVVVDSNSTDNTVAIASSLGARTILQPFLGYREQKAFAFDQASYDHILSLDADESLSEKLAKQIAHIKPSWPAEAYNINRLNHLGNIPIRHGGWYPDRKIRLFNRRFAFMEGLDIHERIAVKANTPTMHLQGDILHYTNKDIEDRMSTINSFTTRAAITLNQHGKRGSWLWLLIKPWFRFFQEYLLLGGFRDGFAGYVIARTSAMYVFLREAKIMELERQRSRVKQDSIRQKAKS